MAGGSGAGGRGSGGGRIDRRRRTTTGHAGPCSGSALEEEGAGGSLGQRLRRLQEAGRCRRGGPAPREAGRCKLEQAMASGGAVSGRGAREELQETVPETTTSFKKKRSQLTRKLVRSH
ncbi:hypothetical protein ZWY2020_059107 [Hordeum vulgare]|nr:hypothetical protein ZWY2020_059107 [Hordeum vulgare]